MKWYDADKVQPSCDRTVVTVFVVPVFGCQEMRAKFAHSRWWIRRGGEWVWAGHQIPQRWRENNAILKLIGFGKPQ